MLPRTKARMWQISSEVAGLYLNGVHGCSALVAMIELIDFGEVSFSESR